MRSIRIWFTKKDASKYISHLDLTRCLIRAFRRTDIPLWYTEGFNPHPYLVFSLPLPLGAEGLREVLDIRLTDDSYTNERVLSELNRVSVPGIEFLEVAEPIEKNLAINKAFYTVTIPSVTNAKELYNSIKCEVNKGDITIEKKTKKGKLFFGCTSFPDCSFTSWDRPIAEKCPVCGSVMFEKLTRGKKKYCPKCSDTQVKGNSEE